MIRRTLSCALLLAGLGQPAGAAEDARFFEAVRGHWSGPGEIVAGKYKGTKFVCTFDGLPTASLGMTLDGGCRVGVFTQKMSATVEHRGNSGYRGTFMDGAQGKGLDVVSGNVVDARKVVLSLHRQELHGAMIARLADQDTLNVTVSVKVEAELVPVIGMSLKRVEGAAVAAE